MGINEYGLGCLTRQRIAELHAAAAAQAAAREAAPRPSARVALGVWLVRLGRWLLRDTRTVPARSVAR